MTPKDLPPIASWPTGRRRLPNRARRHGTIRQDEDGGCLARPAPRVIGAPRHDTPPRKEEGKKENGDQDPEDLAVRQTGAGSVDYVDGPTVEIRDGEIGTGSTTPGFQTATTVMRPG